MIRATVASLVFFAIYPIAVLGDSTNTKIEVEVYKDVRSLGIPISHKCEQVIINEVAQNTENTLNGVSLLTAFRQPAKWPIPTVLATGSDDNPLSLFGTPISFFSGIDCSSGDILRGFLDIIYCSELNSNYPPEPGMKWIFFRSNAYDIPQGNTTTDITVEYSWDGDLREFTGITVASWLSDTTDLIFDQTVVDFFGESEFRGTPIFLGGDLTSNRFNALPNETLQIVTAYDGADSSASLSVEVRETATGAIANILISPIERLSERINTFEYDLNGYELTHDFEVTGVVPDGVVDGLAFGLLWKDRDGDYRMFKSNRPGIGGAISYGAWPLQMNDATFEVLTPQLSDGVAREQARAYIYGATLMTNGAYSCSDVWGGECIVIFQDSFESGDTSGWTTVNR